MSGAESHASQAIFPTAHSGGRVYACAGSVRPGSSAPFGSRFRWNRLVRVPPARPDPFPSHFVAVAGPLRGCVCTMVRSYFSGLSKNTFLMSGAGLFAEISTEMLSPVLPIFLTQSLHASGSIVGLVDGIAQAVRNFIDGFSGSLSDRLRRRK